MGFLQAFEYLQPVLCMTSVIIQPGHMVAQYTAQRYSLFVIQFREQLPSCFSNILFEAFSPLPCLRPSWPMVYESVQSLFRHLGTCTLGGCRMLYSANLPNSFWPIEREVMRSSATSGDTSFLENMVMLGIGLWGGFQVQVCCLCLVVCCLFNCIMCSTCHSKYVICAVTLSFKKKLCI